MSSSPPGPPDTSEPAWAVILGASAGTGAAIARAVARDPGLSVFGAHRGHHVAEAEQVAADVAASGRRAVMWVADAGTAEGAVRGADALLATAGPRSVRLFVHSIANASLGRLASGDRDQIVGKQIQKTFDSMAHSFVYWTQEMLARDLLAPGARILGLTNPLDDTLLHNCGLVAASKAALEVYVRHLAFELGPRGYRVNLLKFPTVITPAVERVYAPSVLARLEEAHRRMIPAGRMVTLDEVARLVSFLASDAAEWFNGATIDFSGGMTQSLLDLVLNRSA
jgi:NAD(P)-dependent dehydrogenase (short-subunit alcohol dehydrogenase family)